ncbi:MAG: hypothetical protein IT233_01510 [Bacteroidia bacterium]|nr:hypothetical protein [Bacteroidia bacterium]
MKNILKVTAGSVLMIFSSLPANAQFSLTGELIPRTEYRHGYQAPLDSLVKGSVATGQRSRLNFGYKSDKFKAKVSFQDVRVWGSTATANTTDGFTSLHEGWGQYFFTPKFSLKAGRQELSYDDERLFGGLNWTFQGRSHDLFLFAFEDTSLKLNVHAGIGYNQAAMTNSAASYTLSNYKEMYYLWANKKFGNLSASLLAVITGVEIPNALNSSYLMNTIGTHIEYKKDALFGSLRFYSQSGETVMGGKRADVNAYMAGADLKYTIAKKFTVGAGMEMMSGQSQTDTTKAYKEVQHTFNALYGTGHKFNGYMDYYFAGSGHGNVGLQDIYLNLKYKADKYWVALDVHMFAATAEIFDPVKSAQTGTIESMDANLGNEIDFTFNYAFTKQCAVQCGYSTYLHTASVAYLKGVLDWEGKGYTGNQAGWGYVMLVLKPEFIK